MKTYDVTILATIVKIYRITADDEDDAINDAHEKFSVLADGQQEAYDQQTINIKEVTE